MLPCSDAWGEHAGRMPGSQNRLKTFLLRHDLQLNRPAKQPTYDDEGRCYDATRHMTSPSACFRQTAGAKRLGKVLTGLGEVQLGAERRGFGPRKARAARFVGRHQHVVDVAPRQCGQHAGDQ